MVARRACHHPFRLLRRTPRSALPCSHDVERAVSWRRTEAVCRPATLFRVIHRRIGHLQQLLDSIGPVGIRRDADAHANRESPGISAVTDLANACNHATREVA